MMRSDICNEWPLRDDPSQCGDTQVPLGHDHLKVGDRKEGTEILLQALNRTCIWQKLQWLKPRFDRPPGTHQPYCQTNTIE
jgi:hypothetical protein